MSDAAAALRTALSEALPGLRAITEGEAGGDRGPGKWVRKEVLGHLIDSAVNNQQRFVRAQGTDRLVWPGYQQEAWVAVQGYRQRSWSDLVDLWEGLNRHLAHVMAVALKERLETPCVIGDDEAVTLEWLMTDYVRHLRHHLGQIFGG